MAKGVIKEKTISEHYDEYLDFLAKVKHTANPFTISETGIARKGKTKKLPNVKGSHSLEYSEIFGNTDLYCEVKSDDNLKYSISVLCENLPTRTLSRFDSDGGTHRNNFPHIPLSEQPAPSPHLHYFDQDGNLMAVHVDFDNNSSPSVDIEKGFDYFCKRLNISSSDGSRTPMIYVLRHYPMPLQTDECDPHENVEFDIIDTDGSNI